MQILENRERWLEEYRQGWLAHWRETGEVDWKQYRHVRNKEIPAAPGVRLAESRLMMISSAGGYLDARQKAFDAPNPLGDYSVRIWPSDTPFEALNYAHGHYDDTMIRQDAQVAIPLRWLADRVAAGDIGKLAPNVVSFMGYQPDATLTLHKTIPHLLSVAEMEGIDAALLAPV